MSNNTVATACVFRHCLWNSRDHLNTCAMRNNRSNRTKMRRLIENTLWDSLLHGLLVWLFHLGLNQLPVTMFVFMVSWYTLAKSEKRRRWGAVRNWHFRVFCYASVASAVCTRHSRDAVFGSSDALSVRFPMFWGHLTLKPLIFNALDASVEFRATPSAGIRIAFGLWWEPLTEGLSLNHSHLRLKT